MVCRDNSLPDWHLYTIVPHRFLKKSLEELSDRFQAVLAVPYESDSYQLLVKGYPEIPQNVIPAEDFLQVGRLKTRRISQKYLKDLTGIISQGKKDCTVSILITSGPSYEFSEEIPEMETNKEVKKVVWMRWF